MQNAKYNVQLTMEQLIELNDLLHETIADMNPCAHVTSETHTMRGIYVSAQREISKALWSEIAEDDIWEAYVDVIGVENIIENYRQCITRGEMIEALTGHDYGQD